MDNRLIPLQWLAYAAGLHLIWEIAQLPLFALWDAEPPGAIVWAVIHCTGGDLLIASFTYGVAALAARDSNWVAGPGVARPLTLLILAGVGYTFFSEWRNVHVLGSWAYSPSMPTILDIGLSPLAQWVVVPLAATLLVAKRVPVRDRITQS